MFRETETNPQMSLFDNPADLMGKRAVKKYEDPKALGLVRMEDEAPSIDTYYLLRRRICEYADLTGENLMETCFSRLTKFQASKFKLSGKSVRMDSKLTGIQGRQSAYLLDESEGGTVRITDTRTGETYEAKLTKSGALRIPYPGAGAKYKWHYFLPKQLESMRSRKRMNDIPQEEKNKRNNVEATVFQLCFHMRNNKTRYRGKRKHELWALARCAWINLRRLVIFEAGMTPKGTTSGQNGFSFAISAIQKTMSQTFAHLIYLFHHPVTSRNWAWTD